MEFFNSTILIVVVQALLLLTFFVLLEQEEGGFIQPEGTRIVFVDGTAWSAWVVQHTGMVVTGAIAGALIALLVGWIVSFWFPVSLWRASVFSLLADFTFAIVSIGLHASLATWERESCNYEGSSVCPLATRGPYVAVVVMSYLLPVLSGLIWAW